MQWGKQVFQEEHHIFLHRVLPAVLVGGGGKIITIDSPHANSIGEVPKTYSSNGETAVNTPYGKGGLGGANSDGQSGSGYGAGGGGGAGLGSTWVNHVARNGGRGLGGYIKILW
ncbi:hypothetical protein DWH15_25560 [Escherichia coli]|nr:hypothetical protein [Escherichia coli]